MFLLQIGSRPFNTLRQRQWLCAITFSVQLLLPVAKAQALLYSPDDIFPILLD